MLCVHTVHVCVTVIDFQNVDTVINSFPYWNLTTIQYKSVRTVLLRQIPFNMENGHTSWDVGVDVDTQR